MNTQFTFRKAERKKAKLRLGLCGPSGSGKTYSAIQIAKGLAGKVAMIDTENGSGDLYAHLGDYDILTLQSPYTPARYVAAIKAAEKAGYDILIIDSLTHAWAGEGGVLDIKDNIAASTKAKNDYFAWRTVSPQHNSLVEAILQSRLHIIATIRSKTGYDMQKNSDGKIVPVKVGLAPIQRDGMEYEFTAVLDLAPESHIATASKDRTEIFEGKYIKPSADTGAMLLEWLNTGADAPMVEQPEDDDVPDVKPELYIQQGLIRISKAPTLGDLANEFTELCEFAKKYKLSRNSIVLAKDKRKAELTTPPPVQEDEFTRALDEGLAAAEARDAKEVA